jgi:hypothetical protein
MKMPVYLLLVTVFVASLLTIASANAQPNTMETQMVESPAIIQTQTDPQNDSDMPNKIGQKQMLATFSGESTLYSKPPGMDIVGDQCIAHGETCTLHGTPCCDDADECGGKFPNTICQLKQK